MSLIEDENKANNEKAAEDRRVAAQEHLVEMERLRLLGESYKNPILVAFRERRKKNSQKLRDTSQKF